MADPTQPTPSWADLSTRLAALLQAIDAPGRSAADLGRLSTMVRGWCTACEAVQASGSSPSPAVRQALTT